MINTFLLSVYASGIAVHGLDSSAQNHAARTFLKIIARTYTSWAIQKRYRALF
jgi:hypothetical protein